MSSEKGIRHIIAPVEGMTCATCVARVENALANTEGVSNVSVNFATEKASFDIDIRHTDFTEIVKFVEDTGYKINLSQYLVKDKRSKPDIDLTDTATVREIELKKNFLLSLILSIPILFLNMGTMWDEFNKIVPFNPDEINKILLILTTPVVFIAGKSFYKIFWQNLKHFSADMNSLVAIGTGSAYLFSVMMTLFPNLFSNGIQANHVYFDTAAVIITLILLGRWLESRAKSRTGLAIKNLIELTPETATVIRKGNERKINLEELLLSDIVIVKPGDKIPADGIIKKGFSSVDESMISGESIPVEKNIGSKVIGGTININGSFEFEVTAIGDKSMLGQIIRMVEEAQGSKAPIQKLADKVSSIFVPIIILIAIVTLIGWLIFGTEYGINTALLNFVAVLIIACPCALGLATPTAIIVGTGLGAQNGILIKNSESLELGHKIKTVIFDKTGTITEGKPKVYSVFVNGINEDEFIKIIASLEMRSEHPLAKAVVEYSKISLQDAYTVDDFESYSGFGLTGKVNGKKIIIGNKQFMEQHSVKTGHISKKENEFLKLEKTVVFAAIRNELKGIIAIEDPIKTGAEESIRKIKLLNLKTVMLTGDNKFAAEYVAKKIGVDEFKAEVLPEQKINSVTEYQRQGDIVAVVGDGINDSPALAQSDVGIAIGTGTDVAIESADIVLVSGDLNGVVNAIKLSKRTIRTIKQNLFWAFIYNLIGVPLAALGILNPIFAALAMSLSSVSVVSNSLRLKKIQFR
jgi:Cu+-exporting ATPase